MNPTPHPNSLSAVVVCAGLVAGPSACGGGGGAGPTAPAAEAPTPLDGVLCDVLPTDLLTGALGFDSYTTPTTITQ